MITRIPRAGMAKQVKDCALDDGIIEDTKTLFSFLNFDVSSDLNTARTVVVTSYHT